jgi:hypothetical protein
MSEKDKHIQNLDVINNIKPVVIDIPGIEPVIPPVDAPVAPTPTPVDDLGDTLLGDESTDVTDELDEVVPTTVSEDGDDMLEPESTSEPEDVFGDDPDESEGEEDTNPDASEPADTNPDGYLDDADMDSDDMTNPDEIEQVDKAELLQSLGFVQEVTKEKETLRVEELKQEDESKFKDDGTSEFTTVKLPTPLLQRTFDMCGLIMDTNGRSTDDKTTTNQMLVVYILARLVGLRLKDVPELMGYSTMQTDKWNSLCDVMKDVWRQKVFPVETYVQSLNQKHMRLLDQQRDSQVLMAQQFKDMEEHYALLETAVILMLGKSVGTGTNAEAWLKEGTPILHIAKRVLEQRKKD